MFRYLLILWVVMPFMVSGQKQGMALADSLSRELRSSRYSSGDTTKARLYVALATAYYSIPDSSIKYANLGAQLSEKLNWDHGIAIAYTSLCYDYSAISDFNKAIDYGKKALAINEKQGRTKEVISSLGNISNCYIAEANYAEATDMLLRALTLAEQIHDKSLTALITQGLGIIYDDLKDYNKSRRYYLEALKLFEQLNDKNDAATVLTNLVANYLHQKEYSLGLSTSLRAIGIFKEMGNEYGLMGAMSMAGGCCKGLHDYSQAISYYRQSQSLSRKMGSVEFTAATDENIGEIYLSEAKSTAVDLKLLDSAIIYLERSLKEGGDANVQDVLSDTHQSLAEAYELKGDYKQALTHFKAYKTATDSVYSGDNRLKIASLETKREKDLKDKQIEMSRLAEIKKRNEQSLLIGGLLVLFIAVVAVLRAHNKQKKANREKETLLKQKDMLMKEIHHRVKNNLQVISTLLDLQLQEVTDEQAKGAMAESTTRVRSISLIHQQLYQHEDIGRIEFSKFAGELVRQVMAVFKMGDVDITFQNEIPEINFDIDTAVPLGLILNELITNSFKYAFSGSSNGIIRIAIHQPNGHYELVYNDSGPGLPDAAQHSSGLGMRMMKSLSKQLGGNFAYNAEEKQVIITFRDLQGRKMID